MLTATKDSFLRKVTSFKLECHLRSDCSVKDIGWSCSLTCGHWKFVRAKLRDASRRYFPLVWAEFTDPPKQVKCQSCRYMALRDEVRETPAPKS